MANPAAILGPDARPIERTRPQPAAAVYRRRREIAARYDAASASVSFANFWAAADHYDADSANSKAVRKSLVARSRYETANNPYTAGVVKSYADYLIGQGPALRMQSGNDGFNRTVEIVWNQWAIAARFYSKLWTMAHARVQDGEAFAIMTTNPRIRSRCKLDLLLIECDQVTTPFLPYGESRRVDGITLDEFGNPETYDVLKVHPGSSEAGYQTLTDADKVPAEYVIHWFTQRRPNQHRGIPELTASLQVGAALRRFREATVTAAETAADFAVILKTNMLPESGTEMVMQPFETAEIDKGLMAALPNQYDALQLKAEHPNAVFTDFVRQQVSELARPLSMPYNIAAADSSNHNYASGKLDSLPFYTALNVDRANTGGEVLDRVFAMFWAECVIAYGWDASPIPPDHVWDFPTHPVGDARSQAIADNLSIRNGSATLSGVVAAAGKDPADEMAREAALLEIELGEYKRQLFDSLFPPVPAAAPAVDYPESLADQIEQDIADGMDPADAADLATDTNGAQP